MFKWTVVPSPPYLQQLVFISISQNYLYIKIQKNCMQ